MKSCCWLPTLLLCCGLSIATFLVASRLARANPDATYRVVRVQGFPLLLSIDESLYRRPTPMDKGPRNQYLYQNDIPIAASIGYAKPEELASHHQLKGLTLPFNVPTDRKYYVALEKQLRVKRFALRINSWNNAIGKLRSRELYIQTDDIKVATNACRALKKRLKGLYVRAYDPTEAKTVNDSWVRTLRGCSKLKALGVHWGLFGAPGLRWITRHFPQLEVLELNGANLRDGDLRLLGRLKNLRWLRLDFVHISGAGLVHLTRLKKLRVVQLDGIQLHTPQQIQGLSSLLELPQLEALELGWEKPALGVFPTLAKLPQLKSLVIRSRIVPKDLGHLRHAKKLRILSMPRSELTQLHLAQIGQFTQLERLDIGLAERTKSYDIAPLGSLTHLRYLSIIGPVLSCLDNMAISVFGKLRLLEGLVFCSRMMTEEIALRNLANLTSLRHLSISYAKVSHQGLAYLKGLRDLEVLKFSVLNSLDDRAIPTLQHFTKLRILELTGGEFTAEGIERLAKLPLRWLQVSGPKMKRAPKMPGVYQLYWSQ